MRQGHEVLLVPLYTPTLTDEPNVSHRSVFFGGISAYLEQHWKLFRRPLGPLDRLCDSRWALKLASRSSSAVNPRLLGEMTVSMLRGEEGFQQKEIRKLTQWLRGEAPPDIITLPNSLLIGLAHPIRQAVGRPVCCTLQGEELFISQLEEPYRTQSLDLIRAKLEHVDGFAAVSQFSADSWRRFLGIPEHRMHVVPLGINLEGYEAGPRPRAGGFRIGYFARIAPEKGLHVLAESYLLLRRESDIGGASLEAAGYLAPEHRGYLRDIERRMNDAGLSKEFRYRGALGREQKLEFLRSLDVLSVPCTYDEPKGIFLLEAMASGVPAVQPRRGAFPEVIERTGGGLLVEPDSTTDLAQAIHRLWKDPALAADLGRRGAEGVREQYSAARMAARALEVYGSIGKAVTLA
jgi:glycosyltransferase involved in cell wall biosynthesis